MVSPPIRSAGIPCPLRHWKFFGTRIDRSICSIPMGSRRIMIAFTYIASGILLALTGWLFMRNLIDATTQTACWTIIFFFASCAASSAYLTVSETFPLEIRALAIAFFYAVGTGIGGILAPLLFGLLIDTGSRVSVLLGLFVWIGSHDFRGLRCMALGHQRRAQASRNRRTPADIRRNGLGLITQTNAYQSMPFDKRSRSACGVKITTPPRSSFNHFFRCQSCSCLFALSRGNSDHLTDLALGHADFTRRCGGRRRPIEM